MGTVAMQVKMAECASLFRPTLARTIPFFVLLLFFFGVADPAVAQDDGSLMKDCASADPSIAIKACSSIIGSSDSMNADDFDAYNLRAKAYLNLGQYDLAIADATTAISINPENGEDFKLRGRAYLGEQKFSLAIADANKAISMIPGDASSYELRGIAEGWLGLSKKAVADESKAIMLSPDYVTAYIERGLAFEDLRNFNNALNDFTIALKLDPTSGEAYKGRGNLYLTLNQTKLAQSDFQRALEIDPQDAMAKGLLGVCYLNDHDWDRGIATLTAAIQMNGLNRYQSAVLYDNRGFGYMGEGQYEKAISDDTEAIRLDPTLLTAFLNRAKSYTELKKYALAEADDEAGVKLAPTDKHPYRGLVSTYEDEGNYAAAIPYDLKLLHIDPADASSWNALCWDRAHISDLNETIFDCKKALALAPHDRDILDSTGYAYLMMHHYALAISYYTKALLIDPKFSSSLYGRSLAEKAFGQSRAAAADRALALKLDPNIADDFSG